MNRWYQYQLYGIPYTWYTGIPGIPVYHVDDTDG